MTPLPHRFHRGGCLDCGHAPAAKTTSCPDPMGMIGSHREVGVYLRWGKGCHPSSAPMHPISYAWVWCAEWMEEVIIDHWEQAVVAPEAAGRRPLALAHLAINVAMSHARWHSIGRLREALAHLSTHVEETQAGVVITLGWWSIPWDNDRARRRDEGKEAWVGVGEKP